MRDLSLAAESFLWDLGTCFSERDKLSHVSPLLPHCVISGSYVTKSPVSSHGASFLGIDPGLTKPSELCQEAPGSTWLPPHHPLKQQLCWHVSYHMTWDLMRSTLRSRVKQLNVDRSPFLL